MSNATNNGIDSPRDNSVKKIPFRTPSAKNQQSLLGFFKKKGDFSSSPAPQSSPLKDDLKELKIDSAGGHTSPTEPSSDKFDIDEKDKENRPFTSAKKVLDDSSVNLSSESGYFTKPTSLRKSRTNASYAESSEDDGFGENRASSAVNFSRRPTKFRRISLQDSDDDEYGPDVTAEIEIDNDDFIAPDDSEDDVIPQKRKRPSAVRKQSSTVEVPEKHKDEYTSDVEPSSSTAKKWVYDPDRPHDPDMRTKPTSHPPAKAPGSKGKSKPHKTEPEQRYTWLANIRDADRNPSEHPDYDPRTIYIPPLAWANFSPFEKQYWEIKQNLWDTIVFFKKGKFYELYEKDATIGHQLFDWKLTDRVNMRMVGVPESSLDQWASQFVAKGFKIARVEQMESALAKEMRERDDAKPVKPVKEDKVVRRELGTILTAGTLVDGSLLQDDMSTHCAAIKESEVDGRPAFGVAFVDTATAQFHLADFIDDADMTKFETFVAQIRPGELIIEKSCISAKALRILKNNTSPTTIWNYLKPGKEYWAADITVKQIKASEYFTVPDGDDMDAWPSVLREAQEKELAISAFGALLYYLRTLKIERDIVTLGNFSWYDPIRKATSLVLDGQSLINLEIFANTLDGTSTGTLFSMLNRCVTPFGKRMLRQWVCHPLADPARINARFDAVDALNANASFTNNFIQGLTKLPDLERLISRVHAGRCKVQEFVKVLEGFEQIEYTMDLLSSFGKGDGIIGQLVSSMPDLKGTLETWRHVFDKRKAREEGILVPEPGVVADFDDSQQNIEAIFADLEDLLKRVRKQLGSSAICYRDNGKEIYQLEVPIKVKNIPHSFQQMSATAKVKRYYFPELRKLVRALQEAQETHGQIVKSVAERFYARFDEKYSVWLEAVKIVAQLDCLVSLARASTSMGTPSCRPEFVNTERSVIEFEELRHPCMLTAVKDFIPNDIMLGGRAANIDLLTGANAAGKSTVLRMTCIAVILAQIGCYVPSASARLTPVDRIMSRLGAHDNIFGAQSTFFVELSETQKILSEATPRSLVILDELGRGTSSYDGLAVAEAVLHHIATHVGCLGFFVTHYRSLAAEFSAHPEVALKRMQIVVDEQERRITFLYRLEEGVAEGSFGMHCAAMCGIPERVVKRAGEAAERWEQTGRILSEKALTEKREAVGLPLGVLSDVAALLKESSIQEGIDEAGVDNATNGKMMRISDRAVQVLLKQIEAL